MLTALSGRSVRAAGITARFDAATVSGFSGCNTYRGTYTVTGSRIDVSREIAATQMACAKRVLLTESAYLRALTGARRFALGPTSLRLLGPTGRMLASFVAQSTSLAGTSWKVLAVNNGKQAVVSVIPGTTLTVEFGRNDDVSGSAGCNHYQGTVQTALPRIAFGPLAATKKFCTTPVGVMDQEAAFLAALERAATAQIDGGRLELRTARGAIAVTLQRG